MWTITSPNDLIRGAGRKPYFSSGKSFAISRIRWFREAKWALKDWAGVGTRRGVCATDATVVAIRSPQATSKRIIRLMVLLGVYTPMRLLRSQKATPRFSGEQADKRRTSA